ncbi:MAG: hypothetical protein V4649_02315 [Bacteroidota bacterium]
MVFDIQIEKVVSGEEIIQALFNAFSVSENEVINMQSTSDSRKWDKAKYLINIFSRPAGFRTSVSVNSLLHNKTEEIYTSLQLLSSILSSRIFIDETENHGKLFYPQGLTKDVRFDVFSLGDKHYIDVIE